MNTMSAWPGQGQGQGHGKRKEPDDFVADLLSSFTLSPPKRARTAVAGLRVDGGPGPGVPVASALLPTVPENAVAAPVFVPAAGAQAMPASPLFVQVPAPAPTPAPAPLSVSAPVALPVPVPPPSEERAIVLYRPVNPPLFPGGPPAGSSELPIQFNTSFMASKAFDLSGTVGGLPQRLSRVSSRSSLPYLPSYIGGQAMSIDREYKADSTVNNNMAVIPWVPLQLHVNDASAGEADIDVDNPEIDPMDVTMEEAPSYSNAAFSPSFGCVLHPQVYGS